MRPIILAALCGTVCASECLDPPEVAGWRYSHRAYHAVAGGIIDAITIEVERQAAPRWTHDHPVLAQVIAGLVVGTAGVCKECIDVHRGPEAFHHQLGDIAATTAGGVVAGIGFTYRFRW